MRLAVLWRKGSFATHCAQGSCFMERMFTVTASLRAQGRGVLAFLREAVTASLLGTPRLSSLPEPDSLSSEDLNGYPMSPWTALAPSTGGPGGCVARSCAVAITNHEQGAAQQYRDLAVTDVLCWNMLLRLLAFLCGPRATDILLHRQRLQLFDRLQAELEVVLDGLQRGIITLEDIDIMED